MVRSPVFKSAAKVENSSSSDEEDQNTNTQNKTKRRLMNSSSSDEGKNWSIFFENFKMKTIWTSEMLILHEM